MIIEIVSNDERYIELNNLLNSRGYSSKICSPNEVSCPDILILSVRDELTDSELETVFSRTLKGTRVFSGNKERIEKYFDGEITDYSKIEYFLQENAHLTAEATVSVLHSITRRSARGQKFFICGYGRIGKALSKILSCLGGEVFVYARREVVQNEIVKDGYYFVPVELATKADVIINTAPSIIFGSELIDKIPNEAVIVELASTCGFESTERVNFAKGLPGKILPKSAARVIFDTIERLIQ